MYVGVTVGAAVCFILGAGCWVLLGVVDVAVLQLFFFSVLRFVFFLFFLRVLLFVVEFVLKFL